jgi:micrococcal nuclease
VPVKRVLLASLALGLALSSCTDIAESTSTSSVRALGSTPVATISDQDSLAPNATVDRVVDGDTIVADINGTRERVRLLGIDTPESVAETRPDQCYGVEASDYLKALLPKGTEITLIRDKEVRDQYDRLLAYVIRSDDQLFVNLDLLLQGYAGVLIYSPNDYYEALFTEAENTAISGDVGLWGVCGGPDVPLE